MKLFLLLAMLSAAIAHFTGARSSNRPTGIVLKSVENPEDTASLTGIWYLVPVLASDTAAGKLPYIRFNITERRFSGFTGCNQMNGSFLLRGDQLQFSKDIALTRMACEGYNEKEFVSNLLRVDHYKIKDGVLWLTTDQTPIAKWMRKPDNKGVL